jgi:hypothetical protein
LMLCYLVAVAIFGLFRLLILMIAIRGTKTEDREKIVLAVAQVFRWWRRPEP